MFVYLLAPGLLISLKVAPRQNKLSIPGLRCRKLNSMLLRLAQGKMLFSSQNVSTFKLTVHKNIWLSFLLLHTEDVSFQWRETDIWHCVFTPLLLCAAEGHSVGGLGSCSRRIADVTTHHHSTQHTQR